MRLQRQAVQGGDNSVRKWTPESPRCIEGKAKLKHESGGYRKINLRKQAGTKVWTVVYALRNLKFIQSVLLSIRKIRYE